MKPVSMAVHSYNEADALSRLIRSSLPFADLIHEWAVIDHRSDDHTPAVLAECEDACRSVGIGFVTRREARDFGPGFVMADLRQAASNLCSAPVVSMVDADYICGPRYRKVLETARDFLTPATPFYGLAFSRPVIWDHLRTDSRGVITDHGRVWLHAIHKQRVEIFARGAIRYEQVGKEGAWERCVPTGRRKKSYKVTKRRTLQGIESALVSVNVKPQERIDLRRTMTFYMREVVQGRVSRPWLDAHAHGEVPLQPEYAFDDVDLRGWRLNLPDLDLAA